MRKQSPGSHSRRTKHMWHEDGTRRLRRGCPFGHLLWSCSQGQEAPRNHTGRTAFSNAKARDSACFPRELLGTSQTLSFRRSQWDFQKTSSTGAMTPCGAFVGETARVEATPAWLTPRPKIITLPYLGPSPQAAPLRSKQGAHYQTAHWRPVHTA